MSDMRQSYKERKAAVAAKQSNMSHADVLAKMRKNSEAVVDLNDLPTQQHIWVDRGVVKSCEGAGHPNHRSYARH